MKKKLAIIGADKSQIPLVNKAKEMGIETHCFAWDKYEKHCVCRYYADYFHPISFFEKEQILEACKEIKIDGVTSMDVDMVVPTVAFVADGMGLTGNHYEDALITGNKFKACQSLLRSGVNTPRFAVAQEGQSPDLTGFKYPLIAKPTDGCASAGVMKANNEKELKEAILHAQHSSLIKQAIVEEFVSGREVSVDAVSWNGKHYFLAIMDKITTGPPHFVEMARHVPSQLSPDSIARIEAEARKSLDALNVKYGASKGEFMITDDGEVYVIEINARMGGDFAPEMIYYSTGFDFIKLIIEVALGDFEEPVIVSRYHSGVYYLGKGYEWVKQVIENKDNDPDIVEGVIRKEELCPLKTNEDRSGYFIYKSDRQRTWNGY